ncbi:MAG: Peptidase S1 and S6 chymotrypsin/Hap [Candidatus Woesebacteria bacterium GW2011_GWC2_33_12]|uniref:Peptidase S1 and S6 chymotrypsin/Hap n=1 Tax=Candidatus Woesebacteria bacterium GW2011_GWB1_33_22 TaxID=1618566 RepID=A0A0F9ZL60_9BACT|nr:MAG: Peptidase S1 and S6 chymotrypsin/Hap [Candidatus Woesebacteria bacterium GW2011_GWC2_33_12]KKP42252.1 MAG: Peptidase S1 and S6 chymotrypsin/Hap [Candidatus Woesebacteria bacterium GW2011_GWA2_33_20]KKP44983.1 MAG: Peptidase S1 and S6 chymotrypsin/Hap [Candidatus Woesebacteria bacterium GW2011_GWB1_33_22]KKP46832.1 MAG: Peptidase S1 and S6 chymotrypsin/Hap [Microgenomates group bacterium GW2011_GWC1_33_28]KKP50704.1 MAG: Peptidase S1 and S6 chymotrypsin/Hap [Candidatus Woesebacteria bact
MSVTKFVISTEGVISICNKMKLFHKFNFTSEKRRTTLEKSSLIIWLASLFILSGLVLLAQVFKITSTWFVIVGIISFFIFLASLVIWLILKLVKYPKFNLFFWLGSLLMFIVSYIFLHIWTFNMSEVNHAYLVLFNFLVLVLFITSFVVWLLTILKQKGFDLIKLLGNLFGILCSLIRKLFKKPLQPLSVIGTILLIVYIGYLNIRLTNIEKHFGGRNLLKCSLDNIQKDMDKNVVRIEGNLSEGSGFAINENQIFTNFHVIEGETSPKIIFSNGNIGTPTKIVGNKEKDMAILTLLNHNLTPLPFFGYLGTAKEPLNMVFGEPLYAVGYAMGSDLKGGVTINSGSYNGERYQKANDINYIQTGASLVGGMSGGPLINSCGQVIGANTYGVAGLSMFIDISSIQNSIGELSDKDISKIKVDTSNPLGIVNAFYTYIGARDLKKAYDLIDSKRLDGQTFEEWSQGYATTLQVMLLSANVDSINNNKINIKLESQDWVDGSIVFKYFEGYWIIDDNLKLKDVSIKSIENPDYHFFYNETI